MLPEPLLEQPIEAWDTLPTIAIDTFATPPVLNTDYFDCEAYAGRVGEKWDKAIVFGQVTVGQDGPMWVELLASDQILAGATAFTADTAKKNVLAVNHGDAGSENPQVAPVSTGQGRYINVRKSLASASSAGNATFVLKMRRAPYMGGKNY